jgi:hypothetical protein
MFPVLQRPSPGRPAGVASTRPSTARLSDNSLTLSGTQYYYIHLTHGGPSRPSHEERRPVTTKLSVATDPRPPQVLSNWKGVVTSPMTPEELSALADQIAGIPSGCSRFYFLVPKRQPPVSEELEAGSVRFLGAQAPAGGRLVAELGEVSDGEDAGVEGARMPGPALTPPSFLPSFLADAPCI